MFSVRHGRGQDVTSFPVVPDKGQLGLRLELGNDTDLAVISLKPVTSDPWPLKISGTRRPTRSSSGPPTGRPRPLRVGIVLLAANANEISLTSSWTIPIGRALGYLRCALQILLSFLGRNAQRKSSLHSNITRARCGGERSNSIAERLTCVFACQAHIGSCGGDASMSEPGCNEVWACTSSGHRSAD